MKIRVLVGIKEQGTQLWNRVDIAEMGNGYTEKEWDALSDEEKQTVVTEWVRANLEVEYEEQ